MLLAATQRMHGYHEVYILRYNYVNNKMSR